jgi:glycosyltransferase involved in cell wall biosynthesis
MGAGKARRLALVIGQLTRGGAESQLALLVRHLEGADFIPFVYCLSAATEPFGTEVAARGVVVRSLIGSPISRVRQLARTLREDRIELLHSWLYLANAFAGCAHLLDPSRPMITSARNCKVQGGVSRLANMLAFRCSRAIVVNSQDVAAYVTRRYRAPQDRIRVIRNGVDIERFQPSGTPGEEIPGPIVSAGRLVEQKNHALFLQAAAQLTRHLASVRFVIVGDGPQRMELEEQAGILGIADRVTFAGERQDVEAVLRTASLFWLTSWWEGSPNVVLEAMACGVPVIATDVGGTRELIRSGVDGFVVSGQEATNFVRHSCTLLLDAPLRNQFARAARARAEEFSAARMVKALSQLYDEVLTRSE